MDIDVVFTAKDGRRFSDPYKCEEYEKRLGTKVGTVGRARIDLKALGEDRYVFGLLKVRHEDVNHYYTYVTRCVDEMLEDYVTVSDVLYDMEQFPKDDLCEYEFLYCDHWEFNSGHPFGCCRTHNSKLWEEMEKAENAKK